MFRFVNEFFAEGIVISRESGKCVVEERWDLGIAVWSCFTFRISSASSNRVGLFWVTFATGVRGIGSTIWLK